MDFINFIKCYQLLILRCCAQYTPLWCRDLDHKPVTSEEGTCLHDVPSQGYNEHYLNKVFLENVGLPPMTDIILIQMNLRWLGHVERMDFARLPRQLLYSQLHDGKRNQGWTRPRFKDIVKRNLVQKNILVGTSIGGSEKRIVWPGGTWLSLKLFMKQLLSLWQTA